MISPHQVCVHFKQQKGVQVFLPYSLSNVLKEVPRLTLSFVNPDTHSWGRIQEVQCMCLNKWRTTEPQCDAHVQWKHVLCCTAPLDTAHHMHNKQLSCANTKTLSGIYVQVEDYSSLCSSIMKWKSNNEMKTWDTIAVSQERFGTRRVETSFNL